MSPKIYLAGPDVFLPNSDQHGEKLVRLCREYDVKGLYPADPDIIRQIENMISRGASKTEIADMIFHEDKVKIDQCDGVIANLAPFRGPESDPGTAWEMGYAMGLGKPVWAYCEDTRPYDKKISDWSGKTTTRDGIMRDRDGMMIDNLGEQANLMMTRSTIDRKVHPNFLSALKLASRYLLRHYNYLYLDSPQAPRDEQGYFG